MGRCGSSRHGTVRISTVCDLEVEHLNERPPRGARGLILGHDVASAQVRNMVPVARAPRALPRATTVRSDGGGPIDLGPPTRVGRSRRPPCSGSSRRRSSSASAHTTRAMPSWSTIANEAARRGCGVHLVVVEQLVWDNSHNLSEVELFGDELSRANTTFLAQCAQRVSSRLDGRGAVTTEILHGPVAASLCGVAENSEMGWGLRTPPDGARLPPAHPVGANGVARASRPGRRSARRLARERAHPPVWWSPGSRPARPGSVARAALDEARRLRSGVRLVHVWSWSDDQNEMDPRIRTSSAIDRTALLRERLLGELSALTLAYPEVEHEVIAVYGRPAYVLTDESARARLLALASTRPGSGSAPIWSAHPDRDHLRTLSGAGRGPSGAVRDRRGRHRTG